MTDQPAYRTIAEEYALRIRTGELPPGSQLPSYSELAQLHGVSDIVVRNALAVLQGQGLVRSVRRRGVFVADPIPNIEPLDQSPDELCLNPNCRRSVRWPDQPSVRVMQWQPGTTREVPASGRCCDIECLYEFLSQ